MKVCGVAAAMSQGHSWTPTPFERLMVNVGTLLVLPFPTPFQGGGGQARGRLMGPGGDGGPVVVRGRESRLHGEGAQQVRSQSDARAGGRR